MCEHGRNRSGATGRSPSRWRTCGEMTGAIFAPTFGALALARSHVVTEPETLLMLEHTLMLPGMLVAMLLRRDDTPLIASATASTSHEPNEGVTHGD